MKERREITAQLHRDFAPFSPRKIRMASIRVRSASVAAAAARIAQRGLQRLDLAAIQLR